MMASGPQLRARVRQHTLLPMGATTAMRTATRTDTRASTSGLSVAEAGAVGTNAAGDMGGTDLVDMRQEATRSTLCLPSLRPLAPRSQSRHRLRLSLWLPTPLQQRTVSIRAGVSTVVKGAVEGTGAAVADMVDVTVAGVSMVRITESQVRTHPPLPAKQPVGLRALHPLLRQLAPLSRSTASRLRRLRPVPRTLGPCVLTTVIRHRRVVQ